MKYIVFILLFYSTLASAQKPTLSRTSLDSLAKINSKLENRIENLEHITTTDKDLDDKYYNSISNQLSGASFGLAIYGTLFAIAGVFLGVYLARMERKFDNIRVKSDSLLKQSEDMLEQSTKINARVAETKRLIDNNIQELFLQLKNEETDQIIKRLEMIPNDISNLKHFLYSRDLDKKYFEKLKVAFSKVDDPEKYIEYINLFFQHYAGLSINEPIIKERLMDKFSTIINYSFKNDIVKTTNDLFTQFIDAGLNNQKEEINHYIKALSTSKFKNFPDLYDLIFDRLRDRNNHFLFYQLLNSGFEFETFKINYGQKLIIAYSNSELTNSESLIISEIKELSLKKLELDNEKNNPINNNP